MSFDSHWLDPGSLGPKHRVWWWLFLPLLWYNLLPTAQGSICETIISKGGLQALTPCGSTLYLAVDNQLYSIPLSDAYLVASPVNGGGGIALYDRTPESAPGYRDLGKWTDVAWLKPALGKPEEPPKTLVTIHIFPKPVVYVHLAFEYEQDKVKKPGFRLVNNGTGQVEVPTETFEPFLGMLTDGDGSGYLVSKEGEDIVVKANPSIDKDKKIPTSGNKYHPYLTDAGTVGFNATKPSGGAKPLLTGAQVHGFKYQGYFHYWDLANKRVLVFKDPVGGGAAQKYSTVLLEKYLVCSNWAQAISGGGGSNGTQNGTVVTGGEGGGGGMGFITKAFLWLLVLVGLGTGGYYGFQYAKSKGLLKRWIKSVAKPKSKTKSKGPSSVKDKSSTPSKTGSAKPGSAKSGTTKSGSKTSTSTGSGTRINPTPPGKSAIGHGTGSKTPTTPTSKSGSKTPSTPTSSPAMTPQAPPTSGVGYFGSSRGPTSVSTSGSTPVGASNVASSNIVTSVTGPASAAAPPKVVGVTLKKDVTSQTSSAAAPPRVVSVTLKKDVATSPVSSPAPPKVVSAVLKKDVASQASGVGSSTTGGSTSAAPPSSKIGTISPGPSNLSQVKPPSNPLMGRSTIQPTPSARAPAGPPPAMLYPPASRAPIPIVPSTTRATTPATSNASSNIAQANSSSSTSPASSTSSSAGGASSSTPTSSTGGSSKGGPSSNV